MDTIAFDLRAAQVRYNASRMMLACANMGVGTTRNVALANLNRQRAALRRMIRLVRDGLRAKGRSLEGCK